MAGARLRDKRNGFSIPPQISLRTVANAIPRPWWWWDFITTPKLEFASLSVDRRHRGELLNAAMDPSINFDDLAEIRTIWPHKIAIKGVQNVEDAKKLADLGVDAIVLSNHGGRQLDRAPVPFHLLPDVVREVGDDIEVMIDTGIMNGADIVASIAMGAKFTLVGRAYIYGLMAGGREGVDRMIEILSEQIVRTMKLLQVTTLDELEPKHVTQLTRFSDLRPRGEAMISGPVGCTVRVSTTFRSRAVLDQRQRLVRRVQRTDLGDAVEPSRRPGGRVRSAPRAPLAHHLGPAKLSDQGLVGDAAPGPAENRRRERRTTDEVQCAVYPPPRLPGPIRHAVAVRHRGGAGSAGPCSWLAVCRRRRGQRGGAPPAPHRPRRPRRSPAACFQASSRRFSRSVGRAGGGDRRRGGLLR